MKIDFGPEVKQRLANELGGNLIEYNSALLLARGQERLRIEFAEYAEGERRLGFRILCGLERAEPHGAGGGYPQDPRPRLDGQPQLLVRRKTAKDRKRRRWKLNRAVRTGDPEFDELAYVDSAAPDEHLQAVLGSPETRRIVKTLLEHQCESVGINKGGGPLAVDFRTCELDEHSLPRLAEQLTWLIEQALSLRASLPLFVGNAEAARKSPLLKGAYYFLLLLLVSGVVSAILAEDLVDDGPVLMLWGGGVGAAVLLVPVFWLVVSGHHHGAGHLVGLTLLGLFTMPLGILGLGMGTNSLFDTSRPQAHRLVVVDKPSCHKQERWVDVQDWRNKRRSFNVRIHSRHCDTLRPGNTLLVVVREGVWGWPWVQDFQVVR